MYKRKKLIVTSCPNLPKYDLLNISNLDKLLQQQIEIFTSVLRRKVSLNYSHSTYVDSKVTVGMVLHSGLIKDDKSKYTKTKTLLVTFKKHTLLSKRTFQRHFENRNSRYLTTLIFVNVTPN